MAVDNTQLAISILELVALLLPFTALLFNALIPDHAKLEKSGEFDRKFWAYLHDPRLYVKLIVGGLFLTATFAINVVWRNIAMTLGGS